MADISDGDTGSAVDSEYLEVQGFDTATGVEDSDIDSLQVWFTLRSPLSGLTVPTITPSFSFTAARMATGVETVTVQLQVSSTSNFSSGNMSMQFDISNLDGRTLNTVGVSSGLADSTDYYWRVRQVQPFGAYGAWSESWKFTTEVSSSGTSIPVSFTVASSTPTPHLWFTRVTRAYNSDESTLYGQGFGTTSAPEVTFVGEASAVSSWELVAAGADAYTSNRVIDGNTGEITTEHGEAVMVIPTTVAAPGGPVKLAASGSVPDPPTPALWYMASDVDSGDTTQWPAHAGAGPLLTDGVADLLTNSLNGQPGMDYSDGSSVFHYGEWAGLDATELRVFYVSKIVSTGISHTGAIISMGELAEGTPDYAQFGPYEDYVVSYISTGGNFEENRFVATVDTTVTSEWQSPPLVYNENELPQTPYDTNSSGTPTLSHTLDWLTIGPIQGIIYEVIVYDRALTTNEEDQVYAYFDSKFAGAPTGTSPTSNSVFLEVLPTALEEIGWEIKVLSHTDYTTELATIPRFDSLTVGVELSGKGAGSIQLDLDDIVFSNTLSSGDPSSDLLDYENLWNAYYNGVLRGQWLGEAVEEIVAADDSVHSVVVSGAGPAALLAQGVVYPAGFPQSQVSTDPLAPVGLPTSFEPEPIFKIYLAYLEEIQNRGTITYIDPMFSDTGDSGGVEWADTNSTGWSPLFDPGEGSQVFNSGAVLGKNMYELLELLSGKDATKPMTVIVDWLMRPGFKLDVRKNLGSHLEDRVIFSLGGAIKKLQRNRVRDSIANVVVVRDELGSYSIATDEESITKYGRREMLVQKSGPQAVDPALRPQIADVTLEQNKDEKSSWVVKVAPDKEGRVVFEDYNVGDWVGVERAIGVVDPYRVLVITVGVDKNGTMEVELVLQSLLEFQQEELARQLSVIENTISNLPYPEINFPTDFNPDDFSIPVFNPDTGQWDATGLDSLGGLGGDFGGGGFGGSGGFGGGIHMFIQTDDPGDAAAEGDLWFRLRSE